VEPERDGGSVSRGLPEVLELGEYEYVYKDESSEVSRPTRINPISMESPEILILIKSTHLQVMHSMAFDNKCVLHEKKSHSEYSRTC
jgi:hypothetical protein